MWSPQFFVGLASTMTLGLENLGLETPTPTPAIKTWTPTPGPKFMHKITLQSRLLGLTV